MIFKVKQSSKLSTIKAADPDCCAFICMCVLGRSLRGNMKIFDLPNLPVDYVIANRWKVARFLGNGLFGSVYDVIDMQSENEEHYAAKVELIDSFPALKTEIEILKKVEHKDHICKLITCGKENDINYMIMTLAGKNLLQIQNEIPNNAFKYADVCKIAIHCFEAIKELHEEQYVHGDIKQENFAVSRDGSFNNVYLLDFGIAKKFCLKEALLVRTGYKEDAIACFFMLISMYNNKLKNRGEIESEFKRLNYEKRNRKSYKNNYLEEFLEVYNYLNDLLQSLGGNICVATTCVLINELKRMELLELLSRADQLSSSVNCGSPKSASVSLDTIRQATELGEKLWRRTTAASTTDEQDDASTVELSIMVDSKVGLLGDDAHSKHLARRARQLIDPFQKSVDESRGSIVMQAVQASCDEVTENWSGQHALKKRNAWTKMKKEHYYVLVPGTETKPTVQSTDGPRPSGHCWTAISETQTGFRKVVVDYVDTLLHGELGLRFRSRCLEAVKQLDNQYAVTMWENVQLLADLMLSSCKRGENGFVDRSSSEYKLNFGRLVLDYLQKQFVEFMRGVVKERLHQAQMGAVPGAPGLVTAFLNVLMPTPYPGYEDVLVNQQPIWAIIYYCLRAGHVQAAKAVAEEAGPALFAVVRAFRRLDPVTSEPMDFNDNDALLLEYEKAANTTGDPYKRAVYCWLTLNDWMESVPVFDRIEDWLWIKLRQTVLTERRLSMAKHPESKYRVNLLPLEALQEVVLFEHGEKYFLRHRSPLVYWTALWFSGQLEAAIEFMCRQGELLRSCAVHVALSLYADGLLACDDEHDDIQGPLLDVSRGRSPLCRLNLVRLVVSYTSQFENQSPSVALKYFYLLRRFHDHNQNSMFAVCFEKLLRQQADRNHLLGWIDETGLHKLGCIDSFKLERHRTIAYVAKTAHARGQWQLALQCYELVDDMDKALQLLINMLFSVVTRQERDDGLRTAVLKLANKIHDRLTSGNAKRNTVTLFQKILLIGNYFTIYFHREFSKAFQLLRRINLIPMNAIEKDYYVSSTSDLPDKVNFTSLCLRYLIRLLLPELMLSYMNMLIEDCKLFHCESNQRGFSGANSKDDLKAMAEALISFASLIRLRLPGGFLGLLVHKKAALI
ncbi:Nuclear pore complex protein Nup93 [Trichinella patagoniensis]|uniref:Nuclear pore complex protein Nup93 n=1 Tax=Trichinella patagoniensis TaxID=990121 RepID=A0A0V1ABC5_9BILA|nr:Nuclear pore complex protein Nup93 [Trichinella patagoniensis]